MDSTEASPAVDTKTPQPESVPEPASSPSSDFPLFMLGAMIGRHIAENFEPAVVQLLVDELRRLEEANA